MDPFSDVLQAAFQPMFATAPPQFTHLVNTFIGAYREFERTGATPVPGYLAMRQLFCATNGEFNDVVHQLLVSHQGAGPRPKEATGVLGTFDEAGLARVVETIARDGYHVFDQRLSSATCDALERLASETPCRIGSAVDQTAKHVPYDRAHLVSNRYDVPESVVAAQKSVQALLLDDSIQAVASAYLGCQPVLDFVSMWWVAPFSKSAEALSKAAQLYHFDMDRLKFLKFFIYLSDVTTKNSPHCYVRGSCFRKPAALLRDGRIPDDEIARHFPAQDLIEVTAPRGSIFAVDTRGFHKGKAVEEGERLLLQLEFTNSLFGQNYGTMPVAADACTPAFAKLLAGPPGSRGRFHLA